VRRPSLHPGVPICAAISLVALAVWMASALSSEATAAKPLPTSPRPRDLDRGVQRKPVGLSDDLADDLHHAADSFRRAGQVLNLLVRLNRLPQPLFDEAPSVTC
jgi:hypothetical protein